MRRIHSLYLIAALASQSGCIGGSTSESSGTQIDLPEGISQELVDAAKTKLAIVGRELDKGHVKNYDFPDPTPEDGDVTDADLASNFVDAVITEYGQHLDENGQPTLLRERLQTLASMVMFSAPEVTTNGAVGRLTPFHGMDDAAFEALMRNEDVVFNHHMQVNGGSPNGVRPFSVCETSFLIQISRGQITDQPWASAQEAWGDSGNVSTWTITSYDGYARAYQAYAAPAAGNCTEADLAEWYNFRGLGALRPTWLESNISDRFLGRMHSECDDPSGGFVDDCAEWDEDRLGYRDRKNTELTLREVFYDPRPETTIAGASQWGGGGAMSMEQYILNPSNTGALVEDRNGDGIGEWVAPGTLRAMQGAMLTIGTDQSFGLPAEQTVTLKSGSTFISDADGQQVSLSKNTPLRLSVGTRVNFAARQPYSLEQGGPIGLNAGRSVRLPAGTSGTLEDGTVVHVPDAGEVMGNPRTIEAKLGAPVSLAVQAGWTPTLAFQKINSGVLASNQFAYEFRVAIPLESGSLSATIAAEHIGAYEAVDPAWDPAYAGRPDLGMMAVFADGSGCMADSPSADTCPLLRRFYSIIDRHENFYQTYSSVRPDASNISQQPSPLVACSITLAASHAWDRAGAMAGGNAGFIYLMRIPFAQIFVGDVRSIDTLGLLRDGNGDGQPDNDLRAGPEVMTLQQLYSQGTELDMSKVWLDIATLSHNQYSSEHEVSKFGSVPAEQIEGILVIRRPAALTSQPEAQPAGEPQ
ncbi:MAG: hypothetical protein HYY06_18055 [Deltaproteobacteria bacterium]|nr:hypothetical protein [Deltaproteobacteria bacterium]